MHGMSAGATELALTTENDNYLMTRRFIEFAKNLTKKKAAGTYDRSLAAKFMMYFADEAAKAYVKQFGGEWSRVFPKADREQVATYFRDIFEERYKDGEYKDFVPAKYKKTRAKKSAGKSSDAKHAQVQRIATRRARANDD